MIAAKRLCPNPPSLPSNQPPKRAQVRLGQARPATKKEDDNSTMDDESILENVDFSWWLFLIQAFNACKPPPSAGPRPKPPFGQVQVSLEPAGLDPHHKLLKWWKAVGKELCHSVTKLWCKAPASPPSHAGPPPQVFLADALLPHAPVMLRKPVLCSMSGFS